MPRTVLPHPRLANPAHLGTRGILLGNLVSSASYGGKDRNFCWTYLLFNPLLLTQKNSNAVRQRRSSWKTLLTLSSKSFNSCNRILHLSRIIHANQLFLPREDSHLYSMDKGLSQCEPSAWGTPRSVHSLRTKGERCSLLLDLFSTVKTYFVELDALWSGASLPSTLHL